VFRPQNAIAAIPRLVLVFFISSHLMAQSSPVSGELTGNVHDSSGAVIPQASIVATNIDTRQRRTALSDQGGDFRSSQLRDGAYAIRVHKDGFTEASFSSIGVAVGSICPARRSAQSGFNCAASNWRGKLDVVGESLNLFNHTNVT
jgi:Carboxypeptidase regulatory-like domain